MKENNLVVKSMGRYDTNIYIYYIQQVEITLLAFSDMFNVFSILQIIIPKMAELLLCPIFIDT